MTNPKIDKIDEDITKTKKQILKHQAKLRELERQRVILEDAEIVARFREGIMTEDDLAAARKKAGRLANKPDNDPEIEIHAANYSIESGLTHE